MMDKAGVEEVVEKKTIEFTEEEMAFIHRVMGEAWKLGMYTSREAGVRAHLLQQKIENVLKKETD